MKKKLFGVFTAILLFVACIGLYACKGKYDDLQFRIFYAYTENAENWIDGTGGIDCFYGDEDGQLPIKDGSSKIYIKVVVENVKAKHVGDIFVSCRTESTGTSFNGAIVKQDEVFSVEMSGKASIVLNVREANSQKNTDVQINASYPLERMEANYDVMPALYADETLDLNQVKEQIINFYPLGQTNQLDVSFAVNSVGFFDAQNEYQRSSKTSLLLSSNAVSITNSVLRLSNYSIDLINVDNYVLEIIAKSSAVADPVTLYVYVLPSADRSVAPQVEYKNDLENAAINGPIVLYSQSGEAENNYSSATLQANANVQSPFVKGVRTKNGLVNYNIALYVDDERVDFSSSSQKVDDENGLIFENPNKEENIFTINSTSNGSIGNLLIDFRLEVNEFLFSNEHRPAKSEFFVQKGQLASGIIVGNRDLGNSRPYTNGGVYTDSIYATQGETKPIFLNLDINSPQSSSQNITAYSIDSSLRILNQNLEVVAGGSIENRSQISVNFANQTATNGSMILRVRNNPETFQGVVCEASYIDVTITITKVVAPDAFVVYRDRDFTQTINSTNRERWLYLGVGEENSFFVRAYYTGTAFDQTCVQITSSNFAFADGTTSAQLGGYLKGGVELDGDFAGKPYYDYEIKFAQINALGVSSINIVAGVNIGVEYVFTAESKMISSGEFTINELAESLDVTKVNEFVANGNKYFNYALVLDKSANFEVLGKGKDANQGFLASYVSGIHVSAVDVDLVSEHISLDAVAVDDRVLSQYNNLFKATGVASERTTMIKIAVDYYVFDGYCKLMSGENAAEIYVQFAVYTPIERFDNLNATSSLLTYVDENAFLDENLASSTVSFVAKTILGRSPSSSVWFYNPTSENLEEVKNATSVKLYTSQKTIDSTVELTYNHERIDTGAILSNDASITVRLTGGKTMDSIRIWFTALRFGQESNKSSRDVIINFRDSAKADRVEIYNGDDGDIVVEGDGINNVYVSYIDVEDDETLVNKKFYATAQYPNSNNNDYKSYRLGYRIYAVTIDGETVNEELVDTISGVEINIQDSEVSISAYKPASTGGGRYKVYIYALDNPDASNSVNLIISDGSRNNPYILSSPEDFRKIQKNLNAHYVLGADISQDNLTITGEFNGTLSGLMQQLDKNNQTYFLTHSITTRLTQSSDNDNRYLSIFQRLGEDAEISDLIVNVGIDSITNNSQANLYAGALAGINNGRIINVEVGINEIAEVQLDIGIGSIYFGGIVGQNNGEINMGNSSVNIYSLKLDLKASSGNRILVGALSGENVGEIIGNYQGKSSLDDIIYTVVANLTVKASGVELNVGGVAGSNNRNIRNMIVGGKIQVNASNSYLGGIAGEGQPASTISTSAVLALDLENTLGAAAGIVGKTNQAVINDVRVLLADANFFEVGVKSQGRIFGKTQSAGIVAQSTGSTITFASVEDFIGNENGEDFFAIQGEDTVAGLVHGSNTEIKSSFVNANLGAATSVCLTSNALNESGTYFIGKVQNFTFANQSNLTLNANTTYAILYTDENLYYKAYNSTNLVEKTMSLTSGMDIVQTSSDEAHKKYEIYGAEFRPEEGGTYELKYDLAQVYRLEGDRYVPLKETDIIHSSDQFVVLTDWETFVKDTLLASAGSWEGNTLVLSGGTTFKLDSEINSIAFKGLSLFFPFVCSVDGDKVEPFMVISPQSIQTNFNEGYVLFIKSNLLEGEIDIGSLIDAGEIKISEILLVNYFEFSNGASSSAYNTHYLINKTRMVNGSEQTLGLLDRTIEPESAQGGVKFEIVYGTNFASLSADGEQITFNGVSGTSPILLRCYSIFNPSKQSFVIFFTQSGISNLKVNSTSVEILEDTGNDPEEDVDYQFTTHSSVGRINLTLEAENLFEGQRFKTIFDSVNQFSLYKLETEMVGGDVDYLTAVPTSSPKSLVLDINDNFEGSYAEKVIKINLYLNMTQYFAGTGFFAGEEDVYHLLATVSVRVAIFKSSESITPSKEAFADIPTSDAISFEVNLQTGYTGGATQGDLSAHITESGDVEFNEVDKDSIFLSFSKGEDSTELENLMSRASVSNIAELFNFSVRFEYYNESGARGYNYTISFSLKDEYDYRFITGPVNLVLIVASTTNPAIATQPIEISFVPTNFHSARIYNYAATESQASGTAILSSSLTDTSYISPKGYGSIMVIHLDPIYSNYETISLASGADQNVPTADGPVYMMLTQLERVGGNTFQVVPNVNGDTSGRNINLNPEYFTNGIAYVHAMVSETFGGFVVPLEATLSVKVAGVEAPIEITKYLTTEFLPAVELEYDKNAMLKNDKAYFIQEDTYQNRASITLYGYEFGSSSPNISFVWNIDENSKFSYKNNSLDVIVDASGREYNIGDYVGTSSLTDVSIRANSDGSYSFDFYIHAYSNIPASFKLVANLSFIDDTENNTRELIFHPVKHLLTGAYLKESGNNFYVNMNTTRRLDLSFTTNNPNYDLSNEIYNLIINDLGGESGAQALLRHFYFVGNNIGSGYFSDENLKAFEIEISQNKIYLTGNIESESVVRFNLSYDYVLDEATGLYGLHFGAGDREIAFSFSLIIYAETTEDAPTAIYNTEQFIQMTKSGSGDYILMNDESKGEYIVLEDYEPGVADIASLDGNNRKIIINSFKITPGRTHYGLFETIGTYQNVLGETKNTILKNVIVDYSGLTDIYFTNNNMSQLVFGGLVAEVESGGLIYNCDVMNLSTSAKTVNIVVDEFSGVDITFGGLVGINNGIITNSRVGRDRYTKIRMDSRTSPVITTEYASSLTFVVGNSMSSLPTDQANAFRGTVGGFVGQNTSSGVIASSFVANTSIKNYSSRSDQTNITAGFVASNAGRVAYSYVKGASDNSSNTARALGSEVSSPTNGNVAGFVYTNTGNIENCFANIKVVTNSALSAGFVYQNMSGATITTSYSASDMDLDKDDPANNAAKQPFVGVDAADNLLSSGTITNCYYLDETGNTYDVIRQDGQGQAVAYNLDNFANANSLSGFVFIQSNRSEERNQGVWSYYSVATNAKLVLPELTTANQISHSYRYLVSSDNNTNVYANAPDFMLGSVNNPNIIRDAEEFNRVLTGVTGKDDDIEAKLKNMNGYFRLINNIDFSTASILTRTDFVLGDKSNNVVTSIEGNGMSISNISLNVLDKQGGQSATSIDKVGLFAEIDYAFIKNIDFNFGALNISDNDLSTIEITYSGGLAGTIDNTALINLSFNGTNTSIPGMNLVGGVAGLITGKSLLYGIDSNLGAISGHISGNAMYYNESEFADMRGTIGFYGNYEDYVKTMSFAGGIAGVLDLERLSNVVNNVSYITVYGNQMSARQGGNIKGIYSGGVAGYANINTRAFKLKFFVGDNTNLLGIKAVGGIYGVGLGTIIASQVTAPEFEKQFDYDKNFAAYILALEENDGASLNSDVNNIGNSTLLSSEGYAGGLIGIGISQTVESCYSKSSVDVASTFGGLMGLSIGSTIVHSYAVPYVNLDNSIITKVGGLIGKAYSIADGLNEFSEYRTYAIDVLRLNAPTNTNVEHTFSTILTDNNTLKEIIAGNVRDYTDDGTLGKLVSIEDKQIDYLCADYQDGSNVHIRSNHGKITSDNLAVFVGIVNNYAKNDVEDVIKFSAGTGKEIKKLYNLDDINQSELFYSMFEEWPAEYWTLDNTKYYPHLIKEDAENFIRIDEASDFDYLVEHPDLNYKIVKDIDMAGWESQHNWVFNVNFTGTLEGDIGLDDEGNLENPALPRVYNLHVSNADYANQTAGLFKQTQGARIRNIDFVWKPTQSSNAESAINLTQNSYMQIGGVSCDDSPSENRISLFSNLNVYVGDYVEGSEFVTCNDAYFLVKSDKNVTGFGGIVGKGESSSIEKCTFNGNVDLALGTDNDGAIYFGGLAGQIEKTSTSIAEQNRLTVRNSSVGNLENFKTKFTLSLQGYGSAYVGGAIGYAKDGSITNVFVGNVEKNEQFREVELTVSAMEDATYLGGFAGYIDNCTISSDNATTKLSISGGSSANSSDFLRVAGLLGRYGRTANSTATPIELCFVKTAIDLTSLQANTVSAAGGVAELYTNGEAQVNQCVFNVAIQCEAESETGEEVDTCTIASICAGGVVARQDAASSASGTIVLNEVTVYEDFIIGSASSTMSIYAGGFVGKSEGEVNALNSIAGGRIVPITKQVAPSETGNYNVYVGGLVGLSASVSFNKAISASSLIADSIASSSIKSLNIHAVLGGIDGEGSIDCTEVYYSSDISLFPEELCTEAYNLSANVLLHTNSWQESFIADRAWQLLDNNLPYLIQTDDELVSYGVLDLDFENKIGCYHDGSAFNPRRINPGALNSIGDDYTFYIIEADPLQTNLLPAEKDLNGVLIGGEMEYSLMKLNPSVGLVNEVLKHSAVSNIHLVMKANDASSFFAAGGGAIAGTNNGAVFNCSVQGTGITTQGRANGLIVGANQGFVAYCYSSAEIIKLSGSLAGIVGTNHSKIMSCYFTGYIDNQTAENQAAGIVLNNGENSYIYNCYMAGLITNITNNAFSASSMVGEASQEGTISTGFGENNYIDINVNKQEVEEKFKPSEGLPSAEITALKTVETQFLMAGADAENNQLLAGNWLTTVKSFVKDYNQYYVDLYSLTYGYNYLYPVYNFYKRDSEMQLNRINYQLYTGTGTDKAYIDPNSKLYESEHEEAAALIFDYDNELKEPNYLYTHAFKVPHLGVLKAVQGIANSVTIGPSGEANNLFTNFNYVLIYDLDGTYRVTNHEGEIEEQYYSWTGVGSSAQNEGSTPNRFHYTDAQFNGLFVSNKYYDFTPKKSVSSELDDDPTETMCRVENLSTQGLFDNINDAYFGSILFGNMYELKNSGALGVKVDSNSSKVVKIDKIYFDKEASYSGVAEADGYVSAMLGSVVGSSNVEISNSGFIQQQKDTAISLTGSTYAGLIIGNLVKGNVSFTGGNNFRVSFDGVNYGGGLIGIMNAGTVYGNDELNTAIHIIESASAAESGNSNTNVGGIVGFARPHQNNDSSQDNKREVSNIDIYFSSEYSAAGLGGLAYEVQEAAFTFSNCELQLESGNSFELTLKGDRSYFGLIAAVLDKGDANTDDATIACAEHFAINDLEIDITNEGDKAESNSKCGYGALIGYQMGGTLMVLPGELGESGSDQPANISLSKFSVKGNNVGGFVGLFEGGKIILAKDMDGKITISELSGYNNVGGAIGNFVDGAVNTLTENTTSQAVEVWNFLEENNFVTLRTFTKLKTTDLGKNGFINWGGLFGRFAASSFDCGNITIKNENKIQISPIMIEMIDASGAVSVTDVLTSMPSIKNVGGVIGRAEKVTFNGTIKNEAEIKTNSADSDKASYKVVVGEQDTDNGKPVAFEFAYNTYDLLSGSNDVYYAFFAQNVGGIIGYATDACTLAGTMSNTKEIWGYAQVGGLIGLFDGKSTITATTTSTNSGTIVGVINVGGAIGKVEGDSNIQNLSVNSGTVSGNFNVGGIVGYFTEATITNCSAGAVEVRGIYFGIQYQYYDEELWQKSPLFAAYFLPSSVGGLIGATGDDLSITGCSVSSTKVLSAQEGYSEQVISTISNNCVNATKGEFKDINQLVDVKLGVNSNATMRFDNMSTGFGGFIGTTSAKAVLANIEENTMSRSTVAAPAGINVGTFYGYYRADDEKQVTGTDSGKKHYIETPTLQAGTFNTTGAYQVGGIAGYISGSSASIPFETKYDAGYVHAAGYPTITIKLQSDTNNSGIYVGGLFGKADVNFDGLKIQGPNSLKININNSSSYYVGGLVGRLEGNIGNGNSVLNSNVVSKDTNIFTVDGDQKENFGGLVGMLKKTTNVGTEAYVIGWHKYAFTINTIENQNYKDGDSTYDYDNNNESQLYLIAQAYYVNQDKFEISYSRGSEGNTVDEGEDFTQFDTSSWFGPNAKNPLNDAFGWARDYTMFKTMQRNIPAGTGSNQSGTLEWDAITQVYDAGRITYVATTANSPTWYGSKIDETRAGEIIYNLNGSASNTLRDKFVEATGDSIAGVPDTKFNEDKFNNYVFFTVYESEEGQSAQLYSRIGVGDLLMDEQGKAVSSVEDDIHVDDGLAYGTAYIDLKHSDMKFIDKRKDDQGHDRNEDVSTLYSNAAHTLTYFGWIYAGADMFNQTDRFNRSGMPDNESHYTTVGGEKVNASSHKTSKDGQIYIGTKTFVYPLDHSIYNTSGSAYFEFKTMFQNYTTSGTTTEYDEEGNASTGPHKAYNDLTLSDDGSVLNVSGMISKEAFNLVNNAQTSVRELAWWEWLLIGFAAVAAVFFVFEAFAVGISALGFAFILSGALAASTTIMGLITGITAIVTNNHIGHRSALNTYFNAKDVSYGYMSATYTRTVQYKETAMGGEMLTQIDSTITDNGELYVYYSSVRPSTYYSEYYLFMKSDLNNISTDADLDINVVAKSSVTIRNEASRPWTDFSYEGTSYAGQGYVLVPTYVYKNGVYYMHMFAAKADAERTQIYFNPDNYNASQYAQINGLYHVQGVFDPTTMEYTINESDLTGNSLYLNADRSQVLSDHKDGQQASGITLDEFSQAERVKFVPQNRAMSAAYLQDISAHGYALGGNGSDTLPNRYYLGYGYMENAYYAANGIQTSNKEDFVGTFKYAGLEADYDTAGKTAGVDYITVNYTYKIQVDTDDDPNTPAESVDANKTLIYEFTSATTGAGGSNARGGSLNLSGEGENGYAQSVTITLYPKSFTNPYCESNQTSGAVARDSSIIYINSNVLTTSGSSGIDFEVTYFYWDGGYKVGTVNGDEVDNNGNSFVYSLLQRVSEAELNSITSKITLYRTGDANSKVEIDFATFIKNIASYNEYYIEPKPEGVTNADALKVKMVYKVDLIDDVYEIYMKDNNMMVEGNVLKTTHVETGAQDVDYNRNKFLMNDDYQIYTRFKFVEGKVYDRDGAESGTGIPFENGIWVVGVSGKQPFYLYRTRMVGIFSKPYKDPNLNKTTLLTESLQVTLGGNKSCSLGSAGKQTTSGQFRAK